MILCLMIFIYFLPTGHSTLTGKRSGQVLSYATRKKFCWKCLRGSKPHVCRKNFERSARAMEPDMAVELVCRNKVLQESNCRVGTLIGDDDSSYISAVRRYAPLPIKKVADINHSTQTLSNNLYKLTPKLDTKVP